METKEILKAWLDALDGELENHAIGTKEREATLKEFQVFYRLYLEETKNERDAEIRQLQLRNERFHKYIQYGIQLGTFTAGTLVYIWLFKAGLQFEQDGSFTSTVFREARQKLRDFMKFW